MKRAAVILAGEDENFSGFCFSGLTDAGEVNEYLQAYESFSGIDSAYSNIRLPRPFQKGNKPNLPTPPTPFDDGLSGFPKPPIPAKPPKPRPDGLMGGVFGGVNGNEREEKESKGKGWFSRVADKSPNRRPLAVKARASALMGARTNQYGFATRLAPAFLSLAEIESHKITPDAVKSSKLAWAEIENSWKNQYGGSPNMLRSAILKGWKKPIMKKMNVQGFDGAMYGYYFNENVYDNEIYHNVVELGEGAILNGANPIVVKYTMILKKYDVPENPYQSGVENTYTKDIQRNGDIKGDNPILNPSPTQEVIEQDSAIKEAAKLDLDEGKGLDETDYSQELDEAETKMTTPNPAAKNTGQNGVGIGKGNMKKYIFIGLGVLAVAGLGYYFLVVRKKAKMSVK